MYTDEEKMSAPTCVLSKPMLKPLTISLMKSFIFLKFPTPACSILPLPSITKTRSKSLAHSTPTKMQNVCYKIMAKIKVVKDSVQYKFHVGKVKKNIAIHKLLAKYGQTCDPVGGRGDNRQRFIRGNCALRSNPNLVPRAFPLKNGPPVY